MGITKTDLFTEEQNDLANLAKVLGHPARIAILQFLIESKSCINTDLVQELGLAQPTISQHLRALKEVGLLQGTIEGTRLNYCIDPAKWQEVKASFALFFEQFSPVEDSPCCPS